MKRIRQLAFTAVFMVIFAALSACGGGGSNSGSGGGSGGGESFAGKYTGTWNATLTGAGALGTGTIVIVINPDGSVELDPDTPRFSGKGTISGNTITASYLASVANSPGITCTGAIAVKGTVVGRTITGTFGPSTFRCNGMPFTLKGTFTASGFAKGPLVNATLQDELAEAVRQISGQ